MLLARGDQGEDVREVQRLLQSWGFDLTTDGDFGSETAAAVEDFQIRMDLEVDGVVGPDTLAALRLTPDSEAGSPTTSEGEGHLGGVTESRTSVLVAVETLGGGRITDKTEPHPADVVNVRGFGGKLVKLHHLAATHWSELVDAARTAGIADPLLVPVSGLRTIARQQELWDRALRKYGSEREARKWVAKPGGSAHHSGRAIDCWLGTPTGSENASRQRNSPAWLWLVEHAEAFGFYPYPEEPWHWEYNPPAG